MKRVAALLIALALISGLIGCPADSTPEPTPPVQYVLTISRTAGGQVTAPGEGTFIYETGVAVSLMAEAEDGYRFVDWTGDVDTIADVDAASTSITMNGDYEITASFETIPPTQYNVTVYSTSGGSVTSPGEGTFTYDAGTVVDLAAEADEGYQFIRWSGDVDAIAYASAASTTVTMNGSYTTVANFEEVDPGTLFAGGSGTASDPYEIANWTHLHNVRDYLGNHFILTNHLHATTAGYAERASQTANAGKGWEPIGYLRLYHDNGAVTEVAERFEGTFDGRGYEIRDLFSNHPDDWAVGFFGAVASEGVIQDLRVVNATVTGYRHVGGLVGENKGTVSNCFFAGWVTGQVEIGGLVGHNKGYTQGSVSDSSSAASVVGDLYVGGLVGWNTGHVYDSHAAGTVTGETGIGGLVGLDSCIVSNSYYNYDEVLINGQNVITIGALFEDDFQEWLANDRFLDVDERLSKEDDYYIISDVGELKELLVFGQNGSLRFKLTSDLDLSAEPNFYIPYLRGEFDGNGHSISNLSFNYGFVSQVGLFGYVPYGGKVTGVGAENVEITGAHHVGGLVGEMIGSVVSNSYSTGSVTGGHRVGGLMGFNWGGPVSNCYSTASVTADSSCVGGLIGDNRGQVDNSYSSGSVTGIQWVGGLIGLNLGPVSSSYATGRVIGTGGSEDVGGLVGWNQYGTVNNSFWDIKTSGQLSSDGGTGKTTAQMMDIATFSGADWNIVAVGIGQRNRTHIWNIVDGQSYPFLSWQPIS